MKIEEANIVKYLGTVVTEDKIIEEKIKKKNCSR
jgi:hypothetical protein